jgi:hypothetical protein
MNLAIKEQVKKQGEKKVGLEVKPGNVMSFGR